MKKTVFLLFVLTLISIISVNAQNKAKKEKNETTKETYNVIKEGKGMDGITIGRSSKEEVEKKFGKEYK